MAATIICCARGESSKRLARPQPAQCEWRVSFTVAHEAHAFVVMALYGSAAGDGIHTGTACRAAPRRPLLGPEVCCDLAGLNRCSEVATTPLPANYPGAKSPSRNIFAFVEAKNPV